MKYIRTKDGKIFNFVEKQPHNYILVNNKETYGDICIHIDEILKQSNTIEELCDEFVFITEDEEINKRDCVKLKKHIFMRSKKGLSFSITERDNKENGYYGAIWADKGLIYVAKMNDKGELELL